MLTRVEMPALVYLSLGKMILRKEIIKLVMQQYCI
jgi:hypothetical protein